MEAGHWFMKKYAKFITDLIQRRLRSKLWLFDKSLNLYILLIKETNKTTKQNKLKINYR